jgi:sugar lactone lactonase YvrE
MHHAFHSFVATTIALVFAVLIAAPSRGDTVYAVSNNNGRIIRYDSANPAGTVVTLSGTGLITSAAGLAIGPDGNLYIGEAGDRGSIAPSIKRFNLTDNTLSTVYTFSAFDVFPGSLLFKDTDLLVGRNPFFGDTGAIVKVSNATSGPISVSDFTTGGELASSPGLAIAADGTLYVSDQTYNFSSGIASGPVKKFDAVGAYAGEAIASGSSGLAGPTGLGIRGNSLFTSSIMNGSILQTNLLGNSTTVFGSAGGPFQASTLALLSDGGLIVGSAGGGGAIYRLDASGSVVDTFNSGLGTIGGLVVAPVPEPTTLVTAAIGLVGAIAYGRRRSGRRS